jgi:RNA polymerase sigma-70 factor (ECF subfamily)
MDNKEFEKLIKESKAVLNYVARDLTNSKQDADDLYQSTILKCFVKFDTWDKKCKFGSWARIVMKNHYLDEQKKMSPFHFESIEFETEGEENLVRTFESNETNVYDQLEHKIVDEKIEELVSQLSDNLREVYRMWLDHYSYNEMAEETGIPISTLKTRVFEAKKKMVKLYNKKSNEKEDT